MGTPDYEQVRHAVLDAVGTTGISRDALQERVTEMIGPVSGFPRLVSALSEAGILAETDDESGRRLRLGPKAHIYLESLGHVR